MEKIISQKYGEDEIEKTKQKVMINVANVLKNELVDKSSGIVIIALHDDKNNKDIITSCSFGKLSRILSTLVELKKHCIPSMVKSILDDQLKSE